MDSPYVGLTLDQSYALVIERLSVVLAKIMVDNSSAIETK